MKIDNLVDKANQLLEKKLGFTIQKSKLIIYSSYQWKEFCLINNFNLNSQGLYVPRTLKAYINKDENNLYPNIFHELFGHGLYCEKSILGNKIVKLSLSASNSNKFLYEDINQNSQQFGLFNRNIYNYEGFALWTEKLLSKELGYEKEWQRKINNSSALDRLLLDSFENAQEKYSLFGLISMMGFPKYYDNNKLILTLKKIYGNDFNNISLIILTGSKKPYSDIDLLVFSSSPSIQMENSFLDIYQINNNDAKILIEKLDVSITVPFFIGSPIYDPHNKFNKIKNQIILQPITIDAINHNKFMSERNYSILDKFKANQRKFNNCLGYVKSYKAVSEALLKGIKLFTLEDIHNYQIN